MARPGFVARTGDRRLLTGAASPVRIFLPPRVHPRHREPRAALRAFPRSAPHSPFVPHISTRTTSTMNAGPASASPAAIDRVMRPSSLVPTIARPGNETWGCTTSSTSPRGSRAPRSGVVRSASWRWFRIPRTCRTHARGFARGSVALSLWCPHVLLRVWAGPRGVAPPAGPFLINNYSLPYSYFVVTILLLNYDKMAIVM